MLDALHREQEESRKRALENPERVWKPLPPIHEVVAGLGKAAEAQMPILEDLAQWRKESGRSEYTYPSSSRR